MKKQEENGINELSEDIEEIGADTDKLLKQMNKTLNELVANTKETKSTKKWVITLFALDKLVMLGIIILGLKLGSL